MHQWSGTLELTGGRTVFELHPSEHFSRFRVRRVECRHDGKLLPIQWEHGKIMERVAKARFAIDRGDVAAARCELKLWANDVPPDDETRRRRYALDVGYVDRHVGGLLDELERLGLYQDSLIVFTSDHGEALGEHKLFGHVEGLTDDQIHVPLIVKLPRQDPRREALVRASQGLVSHVDVVPTLLEIIGLPPLPGQRGTSLFEPHAAVHIAETHRPEAKRTQLALRDERFKMIYFPDEERFVLYDLVADPGELHDVFAGMKGERPSWPGQLRELHLQSQVSGDAESEEDRAARDAMLRALGYGGAEE
jgi:arylsulfatase A-like enzyme